LINALLNISEHQFYENIISTNVNDIEMIYDYLEKIKVKFQVYSTKIELVQKNFKEKSLDNRLNNLKSYVKFDGDVEKKDFFVSEKDFLKDLRFVSIILNNENCNCKFFHWNLFSKYDSIRVFIQCLKYFISVIARDHGNDDCNDETIYRSMRDLLEVIFKLVTHSFEFNQNFLEQGLFQCLIDFFDNQSLLEFLYDGYINILAKTISIFYCLCRQLFYNGKTLKKEKEIVNLAGVFKTLQKSRDIIEILTNKETDYLDKW